MVREAKADDWELVRDIRLAALREAPTAFGSTYEREAAFAEEDWRARFRPDRVTFLADVPGVSPAGIAGGLEEDQGTVELVSIWVSPAARGHGVGEALIEAVTGWARSRGYAAMHLWVTVGNPHAQALYERLGFSATGERQPLPSDPALEEIGMRRVL
jgi:ribosomal protein S18 acetylase RimI-like enzyme